MVQSRLGDLPMLWVETEHFRIGSSLGAYTLGEPWEQARKKDELAELRARLERVPAKARTLDPWLRLHLTAARLERLHADVCRRLGLGLRASDPAPALAMPEKFTVLLTEKKSTLARFTGEFCKEERGDSAIHYFQTLGVLFYGLSTESIDGGTDSHLHYAMVYSVVQNLLRAVNGFPREPPGWWAIGLGLWFARAAEPSIQIYTRPAGEPEPAAELADWQPLVRGRIEAGALLGWEVMLARPSWLAQPFGDNVILWSRLDFLLAREGCAHRLAATLHAPAERMDSTEALARATGLELEALDEAWRAWVRETYGKKRR